jgi:predicted ATPase
LLAPLLHAGRILMEEKSGVGLASICRRRSAAPLPPEGLAALLEALGLGSLSALLLPSFLRRPSLTTKLRHESLKLLVA